MLSEYKEWFIAAFTFVIGFYGNRLTAKKDNRQGDQELINKLFEDIKRIDLENKDVRERLDKLEKENRELRETKHELQLVNNSLLVENVELKEVITKLEVENLELKLEIIEEEKQ